MQNYTRTVNISRSLFSFLGIAILSPKWRYWRFWLFIVLLGYPIVNGGIMASIAMQVGYQKLYSTCIYVMFPNIMVFLKLVVLVMSQREFNSLMDWVKRCFEQKYGIDVVDQVWAEVSEKCTNKTVLFTRAFYAMNVFDIIFTFGINIAFAWGTPPLADYIFFFSDESHPYFYILNTAYQFYVFFVMCIAALVLECPFILISLFFQARFQFVGRLTELLNNPHQSGVSRLRLINLMTEVHSDVLKAVLKFSKMFELVLLIQIVGSMGAEVFALYIIQTKFYFSMMFSATAVMLQVFLYCYLGDIVVQVADPLPNQVYCTNWHTFSLIEKRHLLLVMFRAQQPVFLSIGKVGRLDLRAFVNIARAAYSYSAVLMTMSE